MNKSRNLNKTELMTFIGYLLKTFKLMLMIANASYFVGIFWIFFFDYNEYVATWNDFPLDDHFRYFYSINGNKDNLEQIIIYSYYSFTTLTTVGFGDYAPRSDGERVMGSIVLLFGVVVFSYIMGSFIEILD